MKAIIFDGDREYIINVDFFYQNLLISDKSRLEILNLYECNKIYELTAKQVRDQGLMDIIPAVNDSMINSVVKGNSLLTGMIIDMNGEVLGNALIKQIDSNLKQFLTTKNIEDDLKNL